MEALEKAIEVVGGQARLAEKLAIDTAAISGWKKRGSVPAARCKAIENLTAGKVAAHQLRPDIFGPTPS
ncbi:Cro/CI family transcriptional regulator [Spongiibacter tropicus]|uniref:transcriptional regulator n=1 Tax=Spongiibacter tropicus TaxID=454602 RepID=UPI0003B46C45